jgi:hypothetical protein
MFNHFVVVGGESAKASEIWNATLSHDLFHAERKWKI